MKMSGSFWPEGGANWVMLKYQIFAFNKSCESSLAAASVFVRLRLVSLQFPQRPVAGLSFRDHFFLPFFEGSRVKGNEPKGRKPLLFVYT